MARTNPYHVTAFAYAAREGSFSRAAQRMGVSQSAVSQHVAALEREVGAPLLIRDRKGLELTRAGQRFYELAERYATLDQLIAERIEDFATLEAGHLSIIANSPRPALQYMERFRHRFPKVEIDFTLESWTDSMRLIREQRADIGIVTEPRGLGDCYIREVSRHGYRIYMRPDYPLAGAAALSLADLREETVLLPEPGSFTFRIVSEKQRDTGIVLERVIQTANFPVMKEAVLHGVGVGIFLEDSMHPSDRLVTVPIREMPETYATCIVRRNDRKTMRAVRSFIELALEPSGLAA
ncbi:LysR family transcriptional regulator [Pontivivens ytuae]|uniref:LysR family transcriptional regulator n=1 Tax=Pontivivens ytuae TaxID=2789856 RepID=A0A7S9LQX3_9RHOB|nr:LysR family transcriptional regulator [Pontivivens ytuae]QPH53656.1 LysR family transcriptional regulator [Pontivivens ytuae]